MFCSASFLLIIFAVALVVLYFSWNNNHWKKRNVPHIPPQFFLGNTPNTILQKRNAYYDLQTIFKKFRDNYNIAGFFSFRKPNLLVLDPSIAKRVLLTDFQKFAYNDFVSVIDKEIDPILGFNPFFLNGTEWKERRADVTPAFTVARLRSMYPLIEDVSRNLVEYIERETKMNGNSGFDAREISAKFTVDVVSNCIFSLDAGALKKEDSVIREMAAKMLAPSFRTVFLFLLNEVWPALNKVLRIRFIPEDVEQFFTKLMKDAAHHRRNSSMDKSDVMQYLLTLQDKKHFNDVELVANAITFFLDGYETSSVSMALILFELGRDQRVQEKLRKEILDAEKVNPLTMDSVAELPYLDQVVHEGLRLNAPTPFTAKRCVVDCELPLDKNGTETIKVEAGTTLTIPIYDIQRDPANFENPLEFIPERFDEEHGGVKAFRDRGSLLIFGMGPRMCLGMRFALTQMKTALVDIVKNYRITVNERTQVPLVIDPKEFLNVPTGGIWVDLQRIE